MLFLENQKDTLKEHLHKTLEYAMHSAPENVGLSLYKAALIASAFHDIGKADRRFQKNLFGKSSSISHALLGIPVVEEILKTLEIEKTLSSLILLAIATHHAPLRNDLFFSVGNELKFEIESDAVFELQEIINSLLNRLDEAHTFKFNPEVLKTPKGIFEIAKRHVLLQENGLELRNKFIYIKGVLAQSNFFSKINRDTSTFNFPKRITRVPNMFQKEAKKIRGNLFITLPAGMKKTEAALYWAQTNFQGKLFYVIPNHTDVNPILNKLKNTFGEAHTTRYNSNIETLVSILKRNFEKNNPESEEFNEYQNFVFLKYLMSPVNVTTIDQLILTLLNYGLYAPKNYSLYNSVIVLHELLTVNANAFFLVKYLLKYLQQFNNSKICIVTTTFPSKFEEELNFLSPIKLLPEPKVKRLYKNKFRTKPVFHSEDIFVAIQDIVNEFKAGKKVFVMLNTVRRAQEMYALLKETIRKDADKNKVILLHNRFTQLDKAKKECQLQQNNKTSCNHTKPTRDAHILVTTQILAEFTNIDYDTLYTEATYPDLLVQRAGQVNRLGRHRKPCPVHIFVPISTFPLERNLLEHTLNILENHIGTFSSEYDYITLTNKFYNEVWDSIKDAEEDKFSRIWEHLSYIFSTDSSDLKVQELLYAKNGIFSIPAYPSRFRDIIENYNQQIFDLLTGIKKGVEDYSLSINSTFAKILNLMEKKKQYLVEIPFSYYYALEEDYTGEYFVKLKYSEEKGIIDENDNMF